MSRWCAFKTSTYASDPVRPMSQQNFTHAGVPRSVTPSSTTNWIPKNVSRSFKKKLEIILIKLFVPADPITPLSLEMIAEDLPHLLQTLLVGVERAICRIPLDELTFPTVSGCGDHNVIECCTADCLMDAKNAASKRADCNLKRRELITKNNSINKKYAIKRITCSGTSTNESEAVDEETVGHRTRELTASTNSNGVAPSSADISAASENDSLTTGAVASTLPLFCLGGSFPHIDSDEESGDDARKIQSGELLAFVFDLNGRL